MHISETPPSPNQLIVWDPLVRIFHWSPVATLTVAQPTGDEESPVTSGGFSAVGSPSGHVLILATATGRYGGSLRPCFTLKIHAQRNRHHRFTLPETGAFRLDTDKTVGLAERAQHVRALAA